MAEQRWLRTLTASELRVVVTAVVLLPLVALATRHRGLRWVQQRLTVRRAAWLRLFRLLVAPDVEPGRLSELIAAAAHESPWKANCLQRSLVLWWALHVQGHTSEVRMGVRRDRVGDAPDFHAWVELEGRVLNDDPEVRSTFLPFAPSPTSPVISDAARR